MPDFLPAKDGELLTWGQHFSSVIASSGTSVGVSTTQSTAFAALLATYSSALSIAISPMTRTKGTILAKDAAKTALKANARLLGRIINAFPATTNTQRADLGLTPRSGTVAPVNRPTEAPVLKLVSTMGRTMRVAVSGVDTTRRGRPRDIAVANVFSYVGSSPNPDVTKWTWEGATSKVDNIEITFAPTVPAGAQVWLCATWATARGLSGPACTPISAYIAGGVSMLEAA